MDWRLPDGRTIHYTRISPGSGFADPVYETQSNVAPFARSRVSWNGWGWDLALQDGTTWLSPEAYNATRPQQASLIGIFDKNGNEVRLVRKKDGRLVKIKNPDGGWIAFSYDGDGRMTESADTAGHAAKYAYDSDDQISAVHYADGSTTKYAYDSSSRLLTASNSATGLSLSAVYNTNGQIEHLYIDGET
jgi:YD repeat-containing protein